MRRSRIPVPEPSSKFNRVNCAECGEEQVVYSHATTEVACNSCGNPISRPTGSAARISGTASGSAE